MSDTLAGVRELVRRGEIRVSRHGFRELAADEILLHVVAAGIERAIAIEDLSRCYQRSVRLGFAAR
jgi:hypothetical protein